MCSNKVFDIVSIWCHHNVEHRVNFWFKNPSGGDVSSLQAMKDVRVVEKSNANATLLIKNVFLERFGHDASVGAGNRNHQCLHQYLHQNVKDCCGWTT